MSGLPRRNGWALAERAGDRTSDRMQRLLSSAVWGASAAMKKWYAGSLWPGWTRPRVPAAAAAWRPARSMRPARSAGPAHGRRQAPLPGLRRESGQRDHHGAPGLRARGHRACADRGPAVDPARAPGGPGQAAGHAAAAGPVLPHEWALAIDLLGEVLADGIGLDFACGDEVYGSCTRLREFLEARSQGYVLRVPSNFYLTAARGVRLTCKQAAATLLAARRGWEVRSAGPRRQGPALVRLGLAGHRLSASLPAHPPPPGHRRAGLSLLFRPGRPAGAAVPAGPRGLLPLAG